MSERYKAPSGYVLPPEDGDLLAECKVTVFRSSGPGGQHKNTSNTAVRLQHEPTGIVTIGRRERSQSRNMKAAVDRLRERLKELLRPPKKRKKTRVPKASKRKRLEDKKRRGALKQKRKDPEKWD